MELLHEARDNAGYLPACWPVHALACVVEAILAGKKSDPKTKDASADMPMVSDQTLTQKFGLTLLPNVVERTPAFIDDIVDGGLAAASGLQRDDLIVLINDAVITSVTDVQQHLATYRAGQKVSITVNRKQELKTVELRIP